MPDDGTRVFFLHGLMGTADLHFRAVLAGLADGFQVVAPDLPGHGGCQVNAEKQYLDGVYRYVVEQLHTYGGGHLVALSYLGGPVAVRCAREHPELVRSLILTGFGAGMPRASYQAMQAAYLPLVEQSPELIEDYQRMHGPRWRDTLNAYCDHVTRAFDEVFLVQPEVLGALGVDVLLLNGTEKSLEHDAASAAASYGPRVRGVLLDGAGHIPSQDCPQRFIDAARQFWADLG